MGANVVCLYEKQSTIQALLLPLLLMVTSVWTFMLRWVNSKAENIQQ